MRNLILASSVCFALLVGATACSVMDVATPEERTQIETLVTQKVDAEAAGDVDLAAQLEEELAAIEGNVITRAVNGALAVVMPFVPPPARPFVPFLGGLFFGRVRRTVKKTLTKSGEAIKSMMTGDFSGAGTAVGDAVDSVLAIVGLKDSRKDTLEEMQERADEMRASGDTVGAATLEAHIAVMKEKKAAIA